MTFWGSESAKYAEIAHSNGRFLAMLMVSIIETERCLEREWTHGHAGKRSGCFSGGWESHSCQRINR
jgi:hypothetical protein